MTEVHAYDTHTHTQAHTHTHTHTQTEQETIARGNEKAETRGQNKDYG